MANRIGACPVCGSPVVPTELSCTTCNIVFRGRFDNCRFCRLEGEQLRLFEAFVRSRGNLAEVQREIGISYPTLANRLDAILERVGLKRKEQPAPAASAEERKAVLDSLEAGEIDVDAAIGLLKGRST